MYGDTQQRRQIKSLNLKHEHRYVLMAPCRCLSIKLILVMEQKRDGNSSYGQDRIAGIYLWFYMTHFLYFMGQFTTYLHVYLCHVMNFHGSQTKLQATKSLVDIAKRRRNTDLTKKDVRVPKKTLPPKSYDIFILLFSHFIPLYSLCFFLFFA